MISKVLGGVTLAMAVGMFFMFNANASLNERLGAAELSIAQAESTNAINLTAIDTLQAGLNVCVDQRAVDETANAVVVAQLESDLELSQERADRVRIVREEIFRDPSCAELGSLDIGAACPALLTSLLNSSDSLNRN